MSVSFQEERLINLLISELQDVSFVNTCSSCTFCNPGECVWRPYKGAMEELEIIARNILMELA